MRDYPVSSYYLLMLLIVYELVKFSILKIIAHSYSSNHVKAHVLHKGSQQAFEEMKISLNLINQHPTFVTHSSSNPMYQTSC